MACVRKTSSQTTCLKVCRGHRKNKVPTCTVTARPKLEHGTTFHSDGLSDDARMFNTCARYEYLTGHATSRPQSNTTRTSATCNSHQKNHVSEHCGSTGTGQEHEDKYYFGTQVPSTELTVSGASDARTHA